MTITRPNSVYTLRTINETTFKEDNERFTTDNVIGMYTDGIQALTTALRISAVQQEASELDALEYGTCYEVIRALEPMDFFNVPIMDGDDVTLYSVKFCNKRIAGRYKLIISKTALN